jgi:hypothetical protein
MFFAYIVLRREYIFATNYLKTSENVKKKKMTFLKKQDYNCALPIFDLIL